MNPSSHLNLRQLLIMHLPFPQQQLHLPLCGATAYAEVLHWKGNLFPIPHGNSGKRFVRELSRLFRAFGEDTSIECIALAAIAVMPTLLLQNPSKSSKPKDHSAHLERRLILWEKGDINNLLLECRAIQARLPKRRKTSKHQQDAIDIVADGLWGGRNERSYFDVIVINPHARSNRHENLNSMYKRHENMKKRAYDQRVREVEQASFVSLVLSTTGGLGNSANTCLKRLASLLTTKQDQPYSQTVGWLIHSPC